MNSKRLIYVAGPTASGKTSLAIKLAKHFKTEIISCDSRQFYKEMAIGTAVPSSQELADVKHHFIQQKSIQNPYSVGDYQKEALDLLKNLFQTKDKVVLVGGSGLYADALIDGLDHFPKVNSSLRKELQKQFELDGITALQKLLKKHDPNHYKKIDLENPRRLIRALEISLSSGKPYSSFLGNKKAPNFFTTQKLVIQWERATLYERINLRVDKMIAQGMEQEAKKLYPFKEINALQTVGYKEWFNFFDGTIAHEKVADEIKKNTRRYAKRQTTWFRKYTNAINIRGGSPAKNTIMKL